jgi:hypothetical protein
MVNRNLNLALIAEVEGATENKAKIDTNKILENLQEVTISFIPYEQVNKLYIMGDFTEWEPKPMHKNKDIFSYTVVLIKGFKYYYCFNERDQITIDMNNEYDTNPRNNQANNYVDLSVNENITFFDYKLHNNLLIDAKKNYTKARMENQDEVNVLENAISYSTKIGSKIQELYSRREEDKMKIKKFYE